MPKRADDKLELIPGTLEMLILKTLIFGPAHGHGISKHIRQTTRDILTVEHGSLYPALHRLERNGFVVSAWQTAPDRNRELRFYRLTPAGRKQLRAHESQWNELVRAIARVMRPAAEPGGG
jgi:PadR family transcriptional regulator, regulatory protein PadR